MNINPQQNLVSRYDNQIFFKNNTKTTALKSNNSESDSFVSKHKKEIIAGTAAAGVITLITAGVAYTRGKTVNIANGNESKFFSNIQEGYKSFFGKNKEIYKAIVNKTDTEVSAKPIAEPGAKPLTEINSALDDAQEEFESFMQKTSVPENSLKDINTEFFTETQKADFEKVCDKINDIKAKHVCDIEEMQRFVWSKELEFREKLPSLDETANAAMTRFNNGEGITETNGLRIIKDYDSKGTLLREITLDKGKLTINDLENKTLLTGKNTLSNTFELSQYFEGYETLENGSVKYDRMYGRNKASNAYSSYKEDDGRIIGEYKEDYNSKDGHTTIKKMFSFNSEEAKWGNSNACLSTQEIVDMLNGKTKLQRTTPCFGVDFEELADGSETYGQKISATSQSAVDCFRNLKKSSSAQNDIESKYDTWVEAKHKDVKTIKSLHLGCTLGELIKSANN